MLLKNLIATAGTNDKRTMGTRWKQKKGPMSNAVILNIKRCGIPFDIWAKEDEYAKQGTSLVGY